MAKLSTEDLLGQFKEMTLVELSDFVKSFETEFDVKASATVAVAAAGGAVEAEAAQDEFTLTLESAGAQKIALIKEVRGINSSLGLKEAKDIVDAAPAVLIEKGTKEAVEKAKAALEAAGATVSVK